MTRSLLSLTGALCTLSLALLANALIAAHRRPRRAISSVQAPGCNNDRMRRILATTETSLDSHAVTAAKPTNLAPEDLNLSTMIVQGDSPSASPSPIAATADEDSEEDFGSARYGPTAIILNMNARSVTPQICDLARTVFGDDNVFVTRTSEDAILAARTIVRQRRRLVVPVGGDGTLSGWINTMVDEIRLLNEVDSQRSGSLSTEESIGRLPTIGYLPLGTGNGMGYVIGAKTNIKMKGLSKISPRRRKLEHTNEVMLRLKEAGDSMQADDVVSCSIVEMPMMEVTHNETSEHGNLCFFAGAGFDSLMLHDFYQIKSWATTAASLPTFMRNSLSSVVGYCVALVTKTLPQTLRFGTHKIHVTVTTRDPNCLWVDHRRGDFSEPAISNYTSSNCNLIYSGEAGIIAASTTPFYGGGLRLFPYARMIPGKLQLRLGRITPLTGFFNVFKIFEGSYRETRSFGCLDFIGEDFDVELRSDRYNSYLKRKAEKRAGRRRGRWFKKVDGSKSTSMENETSSSGFPFQHSGESRGCKESFRVRVVKEPVRFISLLDRRLIRD